MTATHRIRGLLPVSQARFRAAQARMTALLAREAGLEKNLMQLTESRQNLSRSPRQPNDAALIAGADLHWQRWVDQRRATINAELAQLRVLKENCRADLQRAFGQDQVLHALVRRAEEDDRSALRRRASYES